MVGLATYFWIVDFPENSQQSYYFLNKTEMEFAIARIQHDRGDALPTPFSWSEILRQFLDFKIYGFAIAFFLLVGWKV